MTDLQRTSPTTGHVSDGAGGWVEVPAGTGYGTPSTPPGGDAQEPDSTPKAKRTRRKTAPT